VGFVLSVLLPHSP